ncbi:MAG: hypothetical protein QW767_07145 [Thermoprotei archaeon]
MGSIIGKMIGQSAARIVGELADTAIGGLVESRGDRYICEAMQVFYRRLRRGGAVVNHDVQKAVARAYLQATVGLLEARLQQSDVEGSERRQLHNAQRRIKKELGKLQRDDYFPSSSDVQQTIEQQIELLLRPRGTTAQQRVAEFTATLKQELWDDLIGWGISSPSDKLRLMLDKGWQSPNKRGEIDWFDLLCTFFAEELKQNERVAHIFQSRLLANLSVQGISIDYSAFMHQLEQIEKRVHDALQEIKHTVKQGFQEVMQSQRETNQALTTGFQQVIQNQEEIKSDISDIRALLTSQTQQRPGTEPQRSEHSSRRVVYGYIEAWDPLPQLPEPFYPCEEVLRSVEEAIQQPSIHFISVVGPPGVGKTTHLCKVLRDLQRVGAPVHLAVYRQWQRAPDQDEIGQIRRFFDTESSKGKYVLFAIDSFEKAMDERRQIQPFVKQLTRLYAQDPQVRFIVASQYAFAGTEVVDDIGFFREAKIGRGMTEDKAIHLLDTLLKSHGISERDTVLLRKAVQMCEFNPFCIHNIVGMLLDDPQHDWQTVFSLKGQGKIADALLAKRYERYLSSDTHGADSLIFKELMVLEAMAVLNRPVSEEELRSMLGKIFKRLALEDLTDVLRGLDRKFWIRYDDESARYYMHSLGQVFVYQRIEEVRKQKLHRAAAEMYKQRIDERDEGYRSKPFNQAGFRFEDYEYELPYREWLYHLSEVEDRYRYRQIATLHFLEAFEWWGWYLPYAPCEELLHRLQKVARDEDRQWLGALSDFYAFYPPRAKPSRQGNWTKIVQALETLCSILRVSLLQAPGWFAPKMKCRLAALLYNFLADAHHYQGEYKEAERLYKLSIESARMLRDHGFLAWRIFYLAEHYLERGLYGNVIRYCQEVLQMLRKLSQSFEELDHELLAWVRVRLGDSNMASGNPQQAVRNYLLASVHAYAFQVYPSDNHPDEYTLTFFKDILSRISKRLQRESDGWQEIEQFWHRHVGAERPNPPTQGDLQNIKKKKAFRENACRVLAQVVGEIGNSLWDT